MNNLRRFFAAGMTEADRRLEAALAPPRLDSADRYLHDSVIVRTIDRLTLTLHRWWIHSVTHARSASMAADIARLEWPARYQSVAVILIIALGVHLSLTLLQSPRPGWFWIVIPALAGVFASILLLGSSRSSR